MSVPLCLLFVALQRLCMLLHVHVYTYMFVSTLLPPSPFSLCFSPFLPLPLPHHSLSLSSITPSPSLPIPSSPSLSLPLPPSPSLSLYLSFSPSLPLSLSLSLLLPLPPSPSPFLSPSLSYRPWYMDMVRTKPLEVVLLIDANDFVNDVSDTQTLRSAAAAVLDSLTLHDKVKASSTSHINFHSLCFL